jgi:hypothetical protein
MEINTLQSNKTKNMKALIFHLLQNHLDEIVQKSYLNCHVKGLHSIMLLDCPEKTIRLYVATKEHELYKNFPEYFRREGLSVAFHPHHCSLTLEVIKGNILNWIVREDLEDGKWAIDKWFYQSAIKEGKARFNHLGVTVLKNVEYEFLGEGSSSFMSANVVHTVGVGEGEEAAWLVYEGKEDVNYQPYAYSNTDLSKENFDGLYQKPTKAEVLEILKEVDLLSNIVLNPEECDATKVK